MACVNVVAADTDAEAARLATSLQQLFLGIITNKRRLLQPPVDNMEDIWTAPEAQAAAQMLEYSFFGSAVTLRERVEAFIRRTGINEIMATSHIYDHGARLRSYELFAEVVGGISSGDKT